MIEWKQIESAPRDGLWFLGFWPTSIKEDQIKVTSWYEDTRHGGWWIDADDTDSGFDPTHWMQLPSPPEGFEG